MADNGIFGKLFDLDNDGKLDNLEKSVEFATFMSILEDEEKETQETITPSYSLDDDDADDDVVYFKDEADKDVGCDGDDKDDTIKNQSNTTTSNNTPRKRIIVEVVIFVILLAIIIGCYSYPYFKKAKEYTATFNMAFSGQYSEAIDRIYRQNDFDYKETQALFDFSLAGFHFGRDDYTRAKVCIDDVSFESLNEDQQLFFDALYNQIMNKYEEEQASKSEGNIEAQIESHEPIAAPYVGMSAYDLKWLSCGKAQGPVNSFYRKIKGENKLVEVYGVYSEGKVTYILQSVDGVLIDVYEMPSSNSSKSKKSISKDEYDVDDYAHPDDFYYYHIDDFVDYEEAEDYYYKHHK